MYKGKAILIKSPEKDEIKNFYKDYSHLIFKNSFLDSWIKNFLPFLGSGKPFLIFKLKILGFK